MNNPIQIINQDSESLRILFSIENASVNLVGMMNFSIIELLFKINSDVCESYKMEVKNDSSARLTLVLKHILKDLGMPQMYANVRMTREDVANQVVLTIVHSGEEEMEEMEEMEEYEQIPVNKVVIHFDTTNPHKIDICIDVFYNEEGVDGHDTLNNILGDASCKNMQNFVDKMLKTIIKNIINRLKQFIEKMPYSNNTKNAT